MKPSTVVKVASLSLIAMLCGKGTCRAQSTFAVAYDNADLPAYAPQPDHNWTAANGGFGFGQWTPDSGVSGGGTFMDGVGVNGRQVDGNYSFALYSGSGAYSVSRPLSASISTGTFSIATRFDLGGSGQNAVSLRSGNNTSSFGSGELLSFGIVNDSQLSYTDSTGLHTLSTGEARGSVFDWTVNFNAAAGSYTLSVLAAGGGYSNSVSGLLDSSHTTVGSFAVINSSTGNNQNFIFDSPEIDQVPEPTTFALLGLGGLGFWMLRRRK